MSGIGFKIFGFLGALVILLLIVVAFSWWDASTYRKLSDDGWVLYYIKPQNKRSIQGELLNRLQLFWMNKVDVSNNPALAKSKGITKYPTWLNEKTNQISEGKVQWNGLNGPPIILADILNSSPKRTGLPIGK
jgi:hypothetical protein